MRKFLGGCLSIIIISCLLAVCHSGCTSSKHITTEESSFDSSYLQQLENENHLLKLENESLQTKINELQYLGVSFDVDTSCNAQLRAALAKAGLNADSFMNVVATLKNAVKVNADGSFEVEGRIKNLTYQKQKLIEQMQENRKMIDSIKQLKSKVETKVEVKTEWKERVVKRHLAWWLLILMYVLGWLFPPEDLWHYAKLGYKTLFTKK